MAKTAADIQAKTEAEVKAKAEAAKKATEAAVVAKKAGEEKVV